MTAAMASSSREPPPPVIGVTAAASVPRSRSAIRAHDDDCHTAPPGVAVEILVKRDHLREIGPQVQVGPGHDRSNAVGVLEEDRRQPPGDVVGDGAEVRLLSGPARYLNCPATTEKSVVD